MNTGLENAPTEKWRELYRAAIFEADKTKLSDRIDEAHAALVFRMRELFHNRENIQERNAIDAALCALRTLRSTAAYTNERKGFERLRSDAAHAA